MNTFLHSVQTFLHSVTTKDRYATYGSGSSSAAQPGYSPRTDSGAFGPAEQLTDEIGVQLYQDPATTTTATSSNNPYQYSLPTSASATSLSKNNTASPKLVRQPYTPGMRSAQARTPASASASSIPLQDFGSGGAPPPPTPALSWKRIDRWLELNYPELQDQVNDPVTEVDLNEFETDFDCVLPADVRDSFLVHDGQERGSRPCGLVFGITMLDLESVAEEWSHWKTAAARISEAIKKQQTTNSPPSGKGKTAKNASSPSSAAPVNLSWLEHQDSLPQGAVHKVYAHPAWIPLVSDYLGNNLAIDLSPGPQGRWGQVILFGREYDCKYVVAPSWANFLMTFADDLEHGQHLINDEFEEGEFMFRASSGKLVPYFEVLKSRIKRLNPQKQSSATPSKTGQQQQQGSPYSQQPASEPAVPTSPSKAPVPTVGRTISTVPVHKRDQSKQEKEAEVPAERLADTKPDSIQEKKEPDQAQPGPTGLTEVEL